MNRRKEICRNFQRGSCQYGDRCKFLHTSQQQQKPSSFGFGVQSVSPFSATNQHLQQQKPSPFGFGVQSVSPFSTTNQQHQQQKPNPFGFGVQNATQAKGAFNTGGNYVSQPQPFTNKWTRSSSTAFASTKSPKQGDSQQQVVVHKCTDADLCKRQIVEDFNQERPLWRLTCYAHNRGLPCDISGDVSYEELRAVAYEDAKQGKNLQAIVERERNLLKSKLMEFDNFVQSPYRVSERTNSDGPSFVHASSNSPTSFGSQKHIVPSFPSFSQPGASANVGPTIITPSPADHTLGQGNPFHANSQTSDVFMMKLGQSGDTFGTSQVQETTSFHSGNMTTQSIPNFHPAVQTVQASSSSTFPSSILADPQSTLVGQPSAVNHQMVDRQAIEAKDFAVWLKKEWEIGEIPEEEPPAKLCV